MLVSCQYYEATLEVTLLLVSQFKPRTERKVIIIQFDRISENSAVIISTHHRNYVLDFGDWLSLHRRLNIAIKSDRSRGKVETRHKASDANVNPPRFSARALPWPVLAGAAGRFR